MGFEMVARLSCEANHQKLHYKHNLHPSNPTIQKPGLEGTMPPSRHRPGTVPCSACHPGLQGQGNQGQAAASLKQRFVSCSVFLRFSTSPLSISAATTVVRIKQTTAAWISFVLKCPGSSTAVACGQVVLCYTVLPLDEEFDR